MTVEVVKKVVNFFDFRQGRVNRGQFFIISIALNFLYYAIPLYVMKTAGYLSGIEAVLYVFMSFVLFLFFSICSKRAHDFSKSGIWGLLPTGLFVLHNVVVVFFHDEVNVLIDKNLSLGLFIGHTPVILFMVTYVLFLLCPGEAGKNAFGEPAKIWFFEK